MNLESEMIEYIKTLDKINAMVESYMKRRRNSGNLNPFLKELIFKFRDYPMYICIKFILIISTLATGLYFLNPFDFNYPIFITIPSYIVTSLILYSICIMLRKILKWWLVDYVLYEASKEGLIDDKFSKTAFFNGLIPRNIIFLIKIRYLYIKLMKMKLRIFYTYNIDKLSIDEILKINNKRVVLSVLNINDEYNPNKIIRDRVNITFGNYPNIIADLPHINEKLYNYRKALSQPLFDTELKLKQILFLLEETENLKSLQFLVANPVLNEKDIEYVETYLDSALIRYNDYLKNTNSEPILATNVIQKEVSI